MSKKTADKSQQNPPTEEKASVISAETVVSGKQVTNQQVSEIKAAGTFSGDLRQLPPIKPQQQERPQRQAPPIKPRKLRRESIIKPDR